MVLVLNLLENVMGTFVDDIIQLAEGVPTFVPLFIKL